MIVNTKIASMFKYCGFVNIDYFIENKLETNASKILNVLNRDWRKWVKPLCMFDGGDPNFGYETFGTTYSTSIENWIVGSAFTITEDGTANSISLGLKSSTSWTGNVKCAIYQGSDHTYVGETEEKQITVTTTPTWFTFNFITQPNLSVNTAYVLVGWGQSSTGTVYLCGDVGETNQGHLQSITYNDFPATASFTHYAIKDSVYCTYTSAVVKKAKPSGIIPLMCGMDLLQTSKRFPKFRPRLVV